MQNDRRTDKHLQRQVQYAGKHLLSVGTYGSAYTYNVLIWVNDKYLSNIETVTNSFIKVALSYQFPNKRPGRLFGQKL